MHRDLGEEVGLPAAGHHLTLVLVRELQQEHRFGAAVDGELIRHGVAPLALSVQNRPCVNFC
ncbi:hypothetical protein D3C72_2488910 [compost metagenome]